MLKTTTILIISLITYLNVIAQTLNKADSITFYKGAFLIKGEKFH